MSDFTYTKLLLDGATSIVVLTGRFKLSEDQDYFSGRADNGEGIMVPLFSVLYAVMA